MIEKIRRKHKNDHNFESFMSKKFPIEKLERLRSPERLKEMPPAKILDFIDLKENLKIADIGCGVGVYTIPIAKYIKERNGIVWAIDSEPIMLEETKKYAESEGLTNVRYFKVEDTDLNLSEHFDIIVLVSLLHEFPNTEHSIQKIWTYLNNEGYILVVDANLKKTPDEKGPPDEIRIPLNKAIDLFGKYSKDIFYINEFYPNKYLLKVKKSN